MPHRIQGFNDDEVVDFAKLTFDYPLHVRFIELMPIGESHNLDLGQLVTAMEVKHKIEQERVLIPHMTVPGGGPAKYYALPGAKGTIGFISTMSNPMEIFFHLYIENVHV